MQIGEYPVHHTGKLPTSNLLMAVLTGNIGSIPWLLTSFATFVRIHVEEVE